MPVPSASPPTSSRPEVLIEPPSSSPFDNRDLVLLDIPDPAVHRLHWSMIVRLEEAKDVVALLLPLSWLVVWGPVMLVTAFMMSSAAAVVVVSLLDNRIFQSRRLEFCHLRRMMIVSPTSALTISSEAKKSQMLLRKGKIPSWALHIPVAITTGDQNCG